MMLLRKIELNRQFTDEFNHRDMFDGIKKAIDNDKGESGRIISLYGLRRTGKTILMMQLAKEYNIPYIYQVENVNKFEDIIETIDYEYNKKSKVIFIDEITNVKDFVDRAAILADKYGMIGIQVVIAGTDSFGLHLAERDSLFDRTKHFSTTYISYAEHCRVIKTTDIDEFIQYGGLMNKEREKPDITSYEEAAHYLDEAVADNIASSLKNAPPSRYSALEEYTREDLEKIINKIVEIYSGNIKEKAFNSALNRVSVDSQIKNTLAKAYGNKSEETKRLLKTIDIEKLKAEYRDAINSSCNLSKPATSDLVADVKTALNVINLLSTTKTELYDEQNGKFKFTRTDEENYIVLPAIKYYLLRSVQNTLKFTDALKKVKVEIQDQIQENLKNEIFGKITENIVLFDARRALNPERYEVCKPEFTNEKGNQCGEYDMLIEDKAMHYYYAFEIKHTSNPYLGFDEEKGYKYDGQDKHLLNPKFEIPLNFQHGHCIGIFVLYNNSSFIAPTVKNGKNTIYLNLTDFMLKLDETKDINETINQMTKNLPIKGTEIMSIKPASGEDIPIQIIGDKEKGNHEDVFTAIFDRLIQKGESPDTACMKALTNIAPVFELNFDEAVKIIDTQCPQAEKIPPVEYAFSIIHKLQKDNPKFLKDKSEAKSKENTHS